ncbi:hypothetical protein G5S37_23210 [Roseimicrobium sp. ORNL1]|nr:hypothetical protein G5S37_23210 [Roseimicrobium sp. ORNL1]
MVVGVGLIVWGIMLLLGFLLNLAYMAVPAMKAQNPVFKIMEQNPEYASVFHVSLILSVVVALLAGVAGLGLIRSSNWGRILGMIWAAISLLSLPLGPWMTHKYVTPAMAQMQSEISGQKLSESFTTGMEIGAMVASVVMALFWAAVYITILVLLARPKMKAWCRLQETQRAV